MFEVNFGKLNTFTYILKKKSYLLKFELDYLI